jgi:hypothetical protein
MYSSLRPTSNKVIYDGNDDIYLYHACESTQTGTNQAGVVVMLLISLNFRLDTDILTEVWGVPSVLSWICQVST